MSYRIAFFRGEVEIPGWALNLSLGGIRAVIEDRVELGEDLDVHIEEIQVQRRGKVVWIQDEPDGAIVGIAFDKQITPPPGVELDLEFQPTPGHRVGGDPQTPASGDRLEIPDGTPKPPQGVP